jgi:hypothetical protein
MLWINGIDSAPHSSLAMAPLRAGVALLIWRRPEAINIVRALSAALSLSFSAGRTGVSDKRLPAMPKAPFAGRLPVQAAGSFAPGLSLPESQLQRRERLDYVLLLRLCNL